MLELVLETQFLDHAHRLRNKIGTGVWLFAVPAELGRLDPAHGSKFGNASRESIRGA